MVAIWTITALVVLASVVVVILTIRDYRGLSQR